MDKMYNNELGEELGEAERDISQATHIEIESSTKNAMRLATYGATCGRIMSAASQSIGRTTRDALREVCDG